MNRFIEIEGAQNLRDLGGYSNNEGRKIKWRKILRCGNLSRIKESENSKMAALNIQAICDFRTLSEQESMPDRWYKPDEINRFSMPIGQGRLDKFDWMNHIAKGEGKESHLYKANRSYVLKNAHRYQSFFKILLDEKNYPLIFHCTAGKDRTGFAAVLLLTALGVDEKTIMEDYLLTNTYLEKYGWSMFERLSEKYGFDLENIKPILIADEVYLQGAFDAINEHFGSMENFLKKEI